MSFEQSLKGGHPNSLGNTLEVVDVVLGNTDKMEDLFLCYQSDDETVRLRTSNAFKRIFRAKPELFKQWKKRFIKEIAEIDQPSAKWISDFCSNCGCKLFTRVDLIEGIVYVHLGVFDDHDIFKPKVEIWDEYKCSWIKDDGCIQESFPDNGTLEKIQQFLENMDQRE